MPVVATKGSILGLTSTQSSAHDISSQGSEKNLLEAGVFL